MSYPGGRMIFKKMLWYAKLWPHRVRDIELGDLRYQCVDTIRCREQQDEATALSLLQHLIPNSFCRTEHPLG